MSAERRLSNRMFAVAVAALAALFVAAQVVRSVEPLGLDQGLFACFARWVPRGWLPYRDLFDSKPPLFLYSYALSRLFPTDVVHAVWWLEALWLAATLGLTFALAARVWDRWVGLAAAALLFAGLWAPAWGGYWSRAQADEFVALPLVGAAWLAWRAVDRPRPTAALWAGVLTGVAGLFKIPSMAVAAAWPLGWWLTSSWRPSLTRAAWMALGLVLPWAAAFAWFGAHGAARDLFDGAFVYHRYNAAYISPPWSEVLPQFARELATGAPLLVAAAAIGLALLGRRRARETWWLAPFSALTLGAVILERQLAGYHYLLAMPALALAGGYGLVEVARGAAKRRIPAVLALAALLALVAHAGVMWWRAYGIDRLALSGRLARDEYLRRIQLGDFSTATEELAARFLAEHTPPEAGVLVWGLSPGIYALADRHPVTRYPFHKILLTDAPLSRMIPGLDERRAEFLRRLAADPPAYVLVGRRDRNGFEPEDSFSSMMRFAGLRELLERDYQLDGNLGRFVLFRRREPTAR